MKHPASLAIPTPSIPLEQRHGLIAHALDYPRHRRHPDDLRVGDAVDFWRVEALEENRFIRLKAEMKMPGRAWLQYEIRETPNGASRLDQTAAFIPKGLPGLVYWYALYPIHSWIFSGLIKAIARRDEEQ